MNAMLTAAATLFAVVFGLFGAPGKTQAQVASSITVDSVTVTKMGANMYSIMVVGTMTLGPTDTFVGMKLVLTDPNKNQVVPFLNAPPPAQGKSSQYTASTGVNVSGNWSAAASMSFTLANNTSGIAIDSKKFTVGP